MKADRLRRFLAAYKKMSFTEYLESTTGHTGAAGLSRRLSWALEHGDDPEHRDEAEFLLRWEQDLRVIAADEPAVPDAWTAVEAEEPDAGVHSRSPDVLDDEFETVSLDEPGEAARGLPPEPERTPMTEDSDKAAQSAKRRRKRAQAKTLTPMDADEIAAALSSLGDSPGADLGAPALREVFRPPAPRAPGEPEGETASGMATPSFAPRRDRSTLPPTKAAAPAGGSGFLNIIDLPDDDDEDDLEQPTVHAPVGFYDGISDGEPSSDEGLEPATELLGHSHAAALAASLEAPTELPTNDEQMDAVSMDSFGPAAPTARPAALPVPAPLPAPLPAAAPAKPDVARASEQAVPRVDLPPPTAELDLPKAQKPQPGGVSTPVLVVVMLAVAALVVGVALWALGDGAATPPAVPGASATVPAAVTAPASAPSGGLEVLSEPPAAPAEALVPSSEPPAAADPGTAVAPAVPTAPVEPVAPVAPPAPEPVAPAPVAPPAPEPVAPAPVEPVAPAPAPAPVAPVAPAPAPAPVAPVAPPAPAPAPAPAVAPAPAPAVEPAPPTE